MNELGRAVTALRLSCGLTVVLALSACDQKNETQSAAGNAPGTARNAAPASIPMGGNKSVTRFFVTSRDLVKAGTSEVSREPMRTARPWRRLKAQATILGAPT